MLKNSIKSKFVVRLVIRGTSGHKKGATALSWHNIVFILIIKTNEMHYFSDLFDKYSTYFGQVHCPSSGVSEHCIHATGICHVSSVGCLLAWSS